MAHMQNEGFGTTGAQTITQGNNPGALKFDDQPGATEGPNGFAMFKSFQDGYAALKADLTAKLTGKSSHIDYGSNPTLLSYVKVYAPKDDGNDPNGYAQRLVSQLRKAGYNVSINTPLSKLASLLG